MAGEVERLTTWERWCAAGIAGAAIVICLWVIRYPSTRLEEKDVINYNRGQVEKDECISTRVQSDRMNLVLALLAAVAGFSLYAINGLRLSKFSIGLLQGEAFSKGFTKPEPESKAAERPEEIAKKAGVETQPRLEFSRLTDAEKKILRTLWRYQTRLFKGFDQLWTFKVNPDAGITEYSQYLFALGKLVEQKMVFVNTANGQCALRGKGIALMQSIGDEAERGDYYYFAL